MDGLTDLLKSSRLFDGVGKATLRESILPRGTVKVCPKGANLFLPQDRIGDFMLLLSGRIKAVYYLERGTEDIRNVFLPPRLIGVDLICTRTRLSPYQATAVERSEVFAFPAKVILSPGSMAEEERLKCLNNLLLILSQVNMQNEYRLAILTHGSLRERVLVYLTMQASKARRDTFSIPFTREEMASFLAVNRSALSHELGLLRREGIIDFRKNVFTLLRREGEAYSPAEE